MSADEIRETTLANAVSVALGFDTKLDAERNLAGLYAEIKDRDPVGARTLVKVMNQIAAVRRMVELANAR